MDINPPPKPNLAARPLQRITRAGEISRNLKTLFFKHPWQHNYQQSAGNVCPTRCVCHKWQARTTPNISTGPMQCFISTSHCSSRILGTLKAKNSTTSRPPSTRNLLTVLEWPLHASSVRTRIGGGPSPQETVLGSHESRRWRRRFWPRFCTSALSSSVRWLQAERGGQKKQPRAPLNKHLNGLRHTVM